MPSRNLELFLVGRDLSASKAVKGLGHEMEKTSTLGGKLGTAVKVGMLAAAGAVAGAGIEVLHLTDNFEKAHARLQTAIANTGHSAEELKPQISAADNAMANFGFTSTDTENALALLTTATRSPTKALGDLQVAADLARLKDISLAEASSVVAKAQAGQLRGIKQLGLDLPIAAGGAAKLVTANAQLAKAQQAYHHLLDVDHSKKKITAADNYALQQASQRVHDAQVKVNAAQSAGDQIVTALATAVKGQAAAAADTFAGKLEVLKVKAENFGVKVGLVAIPAIEKFASGVVKAGEDVAAAVKWLDKNRVAVEALGIALTVALLPALGRLAAYGTWATLTKLSMGFASAKSGALNLLGAVNPLTVGMAVIGAEVLLSYESWKRWSKATRDAHDAAVSFHTSAVDVLKPLQNLSAEADKANHKWGGLYKTLHGGFFSGIEQSGQKARGSIAQVNENVDHLSHAFGISKDAAALLAEATGNDLTKGMRTSDAAILSWIGKAILANSTTRRFGASTLLLSAYVQAYVRTADGAKNATNALALAYQYLNSQGKDAVVAQLRFKQTLSDDINEMRRSTLTLNQHTAAGQKNVLTISDMIDQAEAAGSALQAQETSTKGVTRATLDGVNRTNSLIAAFEREYVRAGGNKKAFDALLRSMNLLPSQVDTQVNVPGLAAAQAAVDHFRRTILSVPGDISTSFHVAGSRTTSARAGGGPTKRGTTYIIGEEGPELWTAPADGYVTPNSKAMTPSMTAIGGGSTQVHVHIYNAAVGSPREIAKAIAPAVNAELQKLGGHGRRLAS